MSPAKLVVRRVRDGDEPALLAHLEATFGSWPKLDCSTAAIDHLRWKLSSDASVAACNVVAEVGPRIIGALLFVGQRVQTKAGQVVVAHGVDWSVQPEYQRRGLMAAMRSLGLERMADVVDVNLGQSSNESVIALHQSEGYRAIANHPERLVLQLRESAERAATAYSLSAASEFDERSDSLWSIVSQSFDYIGVRDRKWLNWRYCDIRAGDFTVRLAEEGRELLGYCVSRASKRHGAGYIADLIALPERLDVVEMLIEDALGAFRASGLSVAECWLPARHPYRLILDRAGFVRRSRRLRMIYKAMRLPEEKLSFLEDRKAAVHFTLGDSDVV